MGTTLEGGNGGLLEVGGREGGGEGRGTKRLGEWRIRTGSCLVFSSWLIGAFGFLLR